MTSGLGSAAASLDRAALDAYARDGYLIGRRPLFPAPLLDRLEEILQEWLDRVAAGTAPAHLNAPHFSDPRLFDFLAAEPVLDLVESMIGGNIAIWASQFFCKPPGAGQAIGWHADAHYWARFLRPVRVVSIWLALDDASAANGCMRVLPGSHRARRFRYVPRLPDENPFFPRRVLPDDIDASKAVDVELGRGEFLVFDGHLVHGSAANTGTRRRAGFTMRYIPTSCRFDAVDVRIGRRAARVVLDAFRRRFMGRTMSRHNIYLVRGVDLAGNSYTPWKRHHADS